MEAPILRFSLIVLSLFISTGATFQTRNFVVTAQTAEIAEQVGQAAEEYRLDLAKFWLGEALPPWSRACTINVKSGSMGAGGQTTFQFVGGEVMNWNMYVQGSVERILDSVLPHEINHTIFACHFRRPLPRWADEGAATLFEHRSEQLKQIGLLHQVIKGTQEFISLKDLLTMKEYPKGYRPMLILYAEGYALADFLVQQGGRQKYLRFLADGERLGWAEAIKTNYDHGGVEALQSNWQGWVMAGMPKLSLPKDQKLASTEQIRGRGVARPEILDLYPSDQTIRGQSPENPQRKNVEAGYGEFHEVTPAEQQPQTASASSVVGDQKFVEPIPRIEFQTPAAMGRSIPERASRLPTPTRSLPPATSPQQGRSSRFEAPAPRFNSASNANFSAIDTRSAAEPERSLRQQSGMAQNAKFFPATSATGVRSEFEATGLSHDESRIDPQSGKHLPRERSVITGSTPQWAGFPGQKELF